MANLQTQRWQIDRRSFLRGIGATLALPALDAMRPLAAQGTNGSTPVRMALLYMPNGVREDRWTPDGDGTRFKLSPILSPSRHTATTCWCSPACRTRPRSQAMATM